MSGPGQSERVHHNRLIDFAISVGVGLLLSFGLLMLLLFRHLRSNRQLLHAERMRSLEAGIPLEPPEITNMQAKFLHNAFWISFWLGFGVPAAAFWSAAGATKADSGVAVSIVIWSGAAVASVASVACATVLMIYSQSRNPDRGDGLGKTSKPMQ